MTTVYLPDSEPQPEISKLAASPGSLAGLRIGVLDNGKPNAGFVLAYAAERLAAETGAEVTLVTKKGPFGMSANAAIPMARDIFSRLLEETDVVLTGMADCGSCTAYSVSDAIELEKAGKPAVVVTTTQVRADRRDPVEELRPGRHPQAGAAASGRRHRRADPARLGRRRHRARIVSLLTTGA